MHKRSNFSFHDQVKDTIYAVDSQDYRDKLMRSMHLKSGIEVKQKPERVQTQFEVGSVKLPKIWLINYRNSNNLQEILFYADNHETLPLFRAPLINPALVLHLTPFQTTKPSPSVLKCSRDFSRIFFLGFRTGMIPCSRRIPQTHQGKFSRQFLLEVEEHWPGYDLHWIHRRPYRLRQIQPKVWASSCTWQHIFPSCYQVQRIFGDLMQYSWFRNRYWSLHSTGSMIQDAKFVT